MWRRVMSGVRGDGPSRWAHPSSIRASKGNGLKRQTKTSVEVNQSSSLAAGTRPGRSDDAFR